MKVERTSRKQKEAEAKQGGGKCGETKDQNVLG
jgi:hypothetical protein